MKKSRGLHLLILLVGLFITALVIRNAPSSVESPIVDLEVPSDEGAAVDPKEESAMEKEETTPERKEMTVEEETSQVSSWSCGEDWTDAVHKETYYATVRIGTECWMADNMNAGTMIISSDDQGTDCFAIEKYCYSNSEERCSTFGGLYQWGQAMCGSGIAGTRGICPSGWHIPTHDEWTTLERSVCGILTCTLDFPYDFSTRGWRGKNEGAMLKPGGASGFNGLLAGYRDLHGVFGYFSLYGNFWTSSQSGTYAWFRDLGSEYDMIGRNVEDKLLGFSVRCVKD